MLRKNAKIELLKRVPALRALFPARARADRSARRRVYLPAARSLNEGKGAGGAEFLVLVEGEADVVRKGRVVNELGPGDFIGEIALVSGKPRTATVKTRGPARLPVPTAAGFRALTHDVPSIQRQVLAARTSRRGSPTD